MPSSSGVTVGVDIFYKAVHGPAAVARDSKPSPGGTEVGECKCGREPGRHWGFQTW